MNSHDADRTYPLSPAQKRLIFIHEVSGADDAYLFPVNLRLTGPLDIDRLRQALADVSLRHEVLRSRVETVDNAAVQVVGVKPTPLDVTDLSGHGLTRARELAKETAKKEAHTAFDLTKSWIRVRLLRLADDEHVLLVSVHHVAFDGWSCQIFLRELAHSYNARAFGRQPQFEELPSTYGDIARWELERSNGDADAKAVEFWTEQTADLPGDLPLPTDRPRPETPSGRTDRFWWHLGPDETAAVEAAARRHKVTLYMLLLAAFEAALSKAAGRTDFFVGGATAGRRHPDSRGVIGLFVNDVSYRCDVRAGQSFAELIAAVKRRALRVYKHQDLPFDQVVAIASPPRQLDRHPLFQHALTLQPREEDDLGVSFDGLELDGFTTYAEGSALELSFSFHYETDGLHLAVDYAEELWDEPTITVLFENFRTILRALHGGEVERLDDLDLPAMPGNRFTSDTQTPDAVTPHNNHDSPQSTTIIEVFSKLLNVEVSADSDFFTSGGDSILAMRAVTHLRSSGLELGVRDLFRNSTPRRLAHALNDKAPAKTAATVKPQAYVRPEAQMPPLPMHAWLDDARPLPKFYNFSALLRHDGAINPRLFTRAAAVVLKRHDATRMRFADTETGLAVRHIAGTGHERLEVVDLQDVTADEATAQLHAHAADVQASLEILGDGPLIRVVLYQCPGDVSRVLVAACHLVMDVVSMHVLVEDLQQAYAALLEQRAIDLPELTASAQTWSEALRDWAHSPDADDSIARWTVISECAEPDFPVDHPDAPNVVADEQSVFFPLSADDTAVVNAFVAATPGVGHESLMLAATGAALGDRLGDRGILIDLENHGRVGDLTDLDVSRTVGWFTSIFPFPLLTGASASGRRGLMRVTRDVLASRETGLDYSALAAARRIPFAARSVAFSHAGAITTPKAATWRYENLDPQDARHPAMQRRHALEVDSLVVDGILRFSLTYSAAQFDRESIDTLGKTMLDAVLEVADVAR